jgi:hypothetical protein
MLGANLRVRLRALGKLHKLADDEPEPALGRDSALRRQVMGEANRLRRRRAGLVLLLVVL